MCINRLDVLSFFSSNREKWSDFEASYSALLSEFLQDSGMEEYLYAQESKIHMEAHPIRAHSRHIISKHQAQKSYFHMCFGYIAP